jgi:hypothetical protein
MVPVYVVLNGVRVGITPTMPVIGEDKVKLCSVLESSLGR